MSSLIKQSSVSYKTVPQFPHHGHWKDKKQPVRLKGLDSYHTTASTYPSSHIILLRLITISTMADTRYQKIDENSSPLLPSYKHDESFADIPRRRSRFNWTLAAKVSTIANLCFSAIILTLYLHAWAKWRKSPFYNAPDPPYCELP